MRQTPTQRRWPDARAREYAQQWRVTPTAAARILATGYSPEGMEILAIFARLEAKAKATKAVTPKEESCK